MVDYTAVYQGQDLAADVYLSQLTVLDNQSIPNIVYDSTLKVFSFVGLRSSSTVYYSIVSTMTTTATWGANNWPQLGFTDCTETNVYSNISPNASSSMWGRMGEISNFLTAPKLSVTRFPTHSTPISNSVIFVVRY